MVVKIIDWIVLIASLDNTSKSHLKHSKLSEAQHVMINLFVLWNREPYVLQPNQYQK